MAATRSGGISFSRTPRTPTKVSVNTSRAALNTGPCRGCAEAMAKDNYQKMDLVSIIKKGCSVDRSSGRASKTACSLCSARGQACGYFPRDYEGLVTELNVLCRHFARFLGEEVAIEAISVVSERVSALLMLIRIPFVAAIATRYWLLAKDEKRKAGLVQNAADSLTAAAIDRLGGQISALVDVIAAAHGIQIHRHSGYEFPDEEFEQYAAHCLQAVKAGLGVPSAKYALACAAAALDGSVVPMVGDSPSFVNGRDAELVGLGDDWWVQCLGTEWPAWDASEGLTFTLWTKKPPTTPRRVRASTPEEEEGEDVEMENESG